MGTRKKIPVNTPFEDRFWMYVEPGAPDECWLWQGSTNASGYGQMTVRGRHVPAHRASYELSKGHITKRNVCHSCDNRRCVNPAHLYQATQSENMKDAVAKGRISPLILENIKRGEITRAQKALKLQARLKELRERIIKVVGPMEISDEALMRFYDHPSGDTRKRDRFGHFIGDKQVEYPIRPRDSLGQFI